MSTEEAISTQKQILSVSPFRRYVESAAFILVWMIFGWLFRLNSATYLILGVPLVLPAIAHCLIDAYRDALVA